MSKSIGRRALLAAGAGALVVGADTLAQPSAAKAFSKGANTTFAVHGNAVIAENSSFAKTVTSGGTSFAFNPNTNGWFDVAVPVSVRVADYPVFVNLIALYYLTTGPAVIDQVNLYDGSTFMTSLLTAPLPAGNWTSSGCLIQLTSAQQFVLAVALNVAIHVNCMSRGPSGTFLLAGVQAACPQNIT